MIYRICGECEPGSGRIELPALACKTLALKYAQPVIVKCYATAPDLSERDAGSTPVAQLLCTATAASQDATGTEGAVKVDGSVQSTRQLSAGLHPGLPAGSSGTSGLWCTVQPVQTPVAAAQHLQVSNCPLTFWFPVCIACNSAVRLSSPAASPECVLHHAYWTGAMHNGMCPTYEHMLRGAACLPLPGGGGPAPAGTWLGGCPPAAAGGGCRLQRPPSCERGSSSSSMTRSVPSQQATWNLAG
jgi:hypothetical protein